MKTTAALLGAIALIVLLAIGGYLGGWWLQKDSTNRDSEIRRHGYERQTSLTDRARLQIQTVTEIDANGGEPAQRKATVNAACATIKQIVHPDPDLYQFQTQECA